jgi:hypothetical protein
MPRENPCHTCQDGPDCTGCLNNPENAVPVKIYTPKGAARAMLVGKVLKKKDYAECYWGKFGDMGIGFWCRYDDGATFPLRDFEGLYEELA